MSLTGQLQSVVHYIKLFLWMCCCHYLHKICIHFLDTWYKSSAEMGVPRRVGIVVNERSDEAAKKGIEQPFIGPEPILELSSGWLIWLLDWFSVNRRNTGTHL